MYEVGQEFPLTLVITEIEGPYYTVAIKEMPDEELPFLEEQELREIVDKEYRIQLLLEERERINKELSKLTNQ